MLGCVNADTFTVGGAPVTEKAGLSELRPGLSGLAVLSRSVRWLPLQAREWGCQLLGPRAWRSRSWDQGPAADTSGTGAEPLAPVLTGTREWVL